MLALSFQGSRSDLDVAIALRLQAAVVLIFLAARCVHLGQAGIDLALAGHWYTRERLAVGLGAACLAESTVFAAVTLGARRLTRRALLGDAAFAMVGLAVMAVATSRMSGRAGSLNWMLPYSVATATGLGFVTFGDLALERMPTGEADGGGRHPSWGGEREAVRNVRVRFLLGRLWPPALALALGFAYVACSYLPHRLRDEHPAQIWGNAANYVVFLGAAVLTGAMARRRLAAISDRNREVTRAAAQLAREAQWRAVAADVFGPVIDLLDRVTRLDDGKIPASLQAEAGRLISMIDAVRPVDVATSSPGDEQSGS